MGQASGAQANGTQGVSARKTVGEDTPLETEARSETPHSNVSKADEEDSRGNEDGEHALLIVEDDATFRGLLADLVRERGYRPVLTESGKEAILLAQRIRPEGIILDLGLPDLDGLQV